MKKPTPLFVYSLLITIIAAYLFFRPNAPAGTRAGAVERKDTPHAAAHAPDPKPHASLASAPSENPAKPPRVQASPPKPSTATIQLASAYMASYERNRLGALFASLKGRLTDAQMNRLAAALGDRKLEINEIQQMSRAGKIDPSPFIEDARTNATTRITREFGADIADLVTAYERTSDQRAQLYELNTELVYEGTPLRGEQIDKLAALMAGVQKATLDSALEDTPESIDNFIARKEAENTAILEHARPLLTSEQLEALRTRLARYADYVRLRRSQAIDRASLHK